MWAAGCLRHCPWLPPEPLWSHTHLAFFFFFLSTCQDSAQGDAHRGLRSPASPALSHGGVDLYPLGLPLSLGPFCRPVAAAVAAAVRFQHGAPPIVATQWPMNFAQALLWAEGPGCSREACSALSCSYYTRAATRCLIALSMCLGVARFASRGPCSAWCAMCTRVRAL